MFLRSDRIRIDHAYAPATAARHLGVDPSTLDTWLYEGHLDLGVFLLPNGERRIPGSRLLDAVNGRIDRSEETI